MQCALSVLYLGPKYLYWTFFKNNLAFQRQYRGLVSRIVIVPQIFRLLKTISLFRVAADHRDMLSKSTS